MKSNNVFLSLCCWLLMLCLHSYSYGQTQATKSIKNQVSFYNSVNSFIENIGQYGEAMPAFEYMGKIKYGYEGLGMPILFTNKGLIHLQRKIEKISHKEQEKLEKQGLPEEEIERNNTITNRVISMEWIGADTTATILTEGKTTNYNTYGMLPGKAFGYKKITYKNIYPGIDIIYSFSNTQTAGFEYSLMAKPGADLSVVKLKYGGDVKKIKTDRNGNLIIASDINGISISVPVSFYGNEFSTIKASEIKTAFKVNKNEISFLLPNDYDHTKAIIIDPFVTATGNLTGANAGKAKDVDFDYAGNIYVTGGGDGITSHKLAKYNAAGVLQWTFNGTLTIPAWNFGTYYGGWVVEKPTGNIYLAQGFNYVTGFQVIRINTTGLYDNYITTANPNFREGWKMYWNCNNGSPQILVAGGGTNSDINFGTFIPPSLAVGSLNVTGIPYTGTAGWAQDVVDFVIDPANNDMYTLYGSLIGNPSLTNKIYKNTFPYSGASVAWNTPSGFVSVQEVANRPYLAGVQIDNSANIFALNSSYLFYWDGKNLKAFDKATGAGVGTPLTIAANAKLMQGGIVADECNNVFIGFPNGTIKVYKFTGAIFDDAAATDITVAGFGSNSVYDLAYNDAQRILYASGNGFVASFDISAYCPITIYTLNVVPDCLTASAAATVSPVPPLGSTITFVLYNGTTVVETNNTGYFSGLSPNINYKIIATINLICSGSQTTASFVLPGPILTVSNTNTTCGNSTGTITAAGSGGSGPFTYSIDGTNFQASGSFTGLPSGIYSVIVKDAGGCTTTKSVTVLNSNGPTVSFTKTNATCGNNTGTVTANTTGGTAPLQYSIDGVNYQTNNFFTGLIAGQYTVTVKDANGCTNAVFTTIISGPSPEITAIPATATCGSNNGKITAFGSAGTPPLEYSINGNIFQASNVFNNLTPGNYTVTVRDATGCIKTTTVTLDNSPAPTVTATSTTASCNNINGTITATGTGGLAPLQYSINGITFQSSNVFNGLAAGTYTITVKDASGCTNINTVVVTSSGAPTLTAIFTNASCNSSNGSITATASGLAPFQYSINGINFQASNNLTGVAAGTYLVVARDAFGCLGSVPVTIGNIAGPSLTALAAPSSCNVNDGTITATGSGGTAPLQYSIDGIIFQAGNIFSGLAPNTYTITIKDANGCINTADATVANASGLRLTVSSINSSCTNNNGVITAIGSGGLAPLQYSINGVTYQASNVFSNLSGNTYTVYVKDANGCKLSTTSTINIIAAPAIAVNSTNASCSGSNGTIEITGSGGTGVLTYSINNITFLSSGTFINLAPGTYTATVKDSVGCKSTQSIVITNTGTGTGPTGFSLKIRNAYPCNSNLGRLSNFIVTGGTSPFEFSLNFGPFSNTTQFTNLSPGAYTVTVKDANGCTKTIFVTIANAVLSTASAIVTGTACNTSNGTIELTGIGANTPYHASISGIAGPWATFDPTYTFTGLAPGTYTVISADDESFDIGPPIIPGGCLDTITVIVPSTGGPTLSTTKTNISCSISTGTITAIGSGGTAPLQYSIDGINFQNTGDFIDLTAGTYEVTVMDGTGCSNSSFVTITEPSIPIVTATSIPTSCNLSNGSITAKGTGGVAPLQYSIDGLSFQSSGNFINLTNGNYIVYVKDANGCYGAISVDILKTDFPKVVALTVAASCGKSDGAIIAAGSLGTSPYQFSIDGTIFQSNNVFTGLAAGFYTITIKDNRGCINTTAISILNITGPLLNASSSSAKCGNANGTITAAGSGGTGTLQYSINGINFQTSNIFTNLLPGTYTITVKDANGCLNIKTVVVSNINGPQELTSSNLDAACGLSNGSIIATASGGTAPYQYSIDGISYQASSTINNLAASNYTLYVKDANGCIKTLPVALLNLAGPSIATTTSPSSCNASDGTITAIVTGGTGAMTYNINGVSYQSSNIFTGLAAGSYTITAEDERGCSSSSTVIVGGPPGGPSVSAITTDATCGDPNGIIHAIGNSGLAPYQYSIDGINFQVNDSFPGLAPNTYLVTIMDASNCTNTISAKIINIAGATVTATKLNATCGNANGTITANGIGGNKPYLYSIDGISYQVSNIFNGLIANNYTVFIKDSNDCINTTILAVSNTPGATISAIANKSTCGNSNGVITATGAGGTLPYQYSIDGITFQTSNVFSGLAAGTYPVFVKDANNCTNTSFINIANIAGATVSATKVNATCGNSNGTITAKGVGGTLPYQFSIDGTTFQSSTIFNGLAPNTYTIFIKDANNCINTTTAIITNIAGAIVTANTTATTCGNANGTITANGLGGTLPYLFSINSITFQASNNFTALPANTYTVTIKDANNCINTTLVTISNIAGATVTATAINSTCGNPNGSLTATGTGGVLPYQYSIDGTSYQASNIFNGLSAKAYTVFIKDANNCINTTAATILNIAGATVSSTNFNTTCGNANGTINAVGSGGVLPYLYSIDGISYQAGNIFNGLTSKNYTVYIKDSNNCINTTSITISNIAGAAVTLSKTNATCGISNGSITATASGGNSPFQYSIDGTTFQTQNIFSGLAANTYTISIKDANNCINTATSTIVNIAAATVSATKLNTTCGNANGTITATGAGGTSPYLFSIDGLSFQAGNIFNSLAANTYTITIKDANNCTSNTAVTITNIAGATVTASPTASTCGNANGTITATGSGGSLPYQYSINGLTYLSGNTFNTLAANTYTIFIKDANSCINTTSVIISNSAGATVTTTSTSTTCGISNGTITAIGIGGSLPYQFSINGSTFQSSNVFNGLAVNNYTVTIKDANNCINTTSVTISNIAGATITATANASTCGNADGDITATGLGGTTPYLFSIDGLSFQSQNIFSGLSAKNYTITIKDANNCINTTPVTITNINGAIATATATASTCGKSNGEISANGIGGTLPYQYSIDGVTFQTSNLFTGLTANTYTLTIKDANDCINTKSIIISNINGATLTANSTASNCGNADGTITATGIGGILPYQFSIDGITFQSSNIFTGLTANTYTITIKDANNCTSSTAVTINNNNGATITAGSAPATCGNANGSITATGTGGIKPYQYSLDGITYQSSNIFNLLTANNYTVFIKDANNCTNSTNVTITNINGATATASSTSSTCNLANGKITITGTGGTTPYQYSINGITFQPGNIFSGLLANDYTIIIKDANNCINSTTVTVSNIAGATLTATPTASTCGLANGVITTTGIGGTLPYLYSINGFTYQSSNVFNGLAANIYTVTIKDGNNCTNTTSVNIANIAGATVTASKTNTTCGIANGSITASGFGGTPPYLYSINGTNFQSSASFTGLAANTYTLSIKDSNNCINNTLVLLTNVAGASISVTKVNATCGNANGSITATGLGGTLPYEYSIDGVNYQSGNVFSGLAPNIYTIYIRDANNCNNTALVSIANIAGATVTASAGNASCGNANGSITATGLGGLPPYQYSIDGLTFQSSKVFNGLAANNYTITIKDANNCINTTSATVSNIAGAIVTASSAASTCGNANGTITASGTGGTLPYQYSINGITYKVSNIFNLLAAGTYTVYIKDANNCINTNTVIVTNINGATANTSPTPSTCGLANGNINITGTGGTSPYLYSINGVSYQSSSIFNGLAANNYTLSIKDANNCITSALASITNISGATVNAIATSATCGNADGIITATGIGGTSPYQFSIDGTNFQTADVFSGMAVGTYSITIKDANNCTNITPVTINNTNGATVSLVSTSSTCGNTNGTITASGTGGTLPYQYAIDGINFQSSNLFNGLAANTYTVTIKDANNCININSATISNTNGATVTAIATASTCGNANGSITATGIGGTAPYQFSIDGTTFQASNIFNALAANAYTVTIMDANNCINTTTATITNIVGATVTATSSASTCGNANGTITATGAGGKTPYQFSIDGVSFQNSNTFNGLAANAYTVYIKDANNCINSNAIIINNTNAATITASTLASTCGNANGSIIVNGSGGVLPYQYSINGINYQTSNLFSSLLANTYNVSIKDANSCINTTSVTILNIAGATVTATTTATTCGTINGAIIATGIGGTTPYLFSIDGTIFEPSNVFNGLAANNYTVTIKDANNCTNNYSVAITNIAVPSVSAISTASLCGNAYGEITVFGNAGTSPYLFSIDGTSFQNSNLFSGLAANTYNVIIKDANNCIDSTQIIVSNIDGATVKGSSISSTCGNANGSITAIGSAGTAPYQFSIDGIIFQGSNVFSGLSANNYTITIKDANNCTSTDFTTVSNIDGATVTATKVNAACGSANGTITATGTGGTMPYLYSINGISFQISNLFTGLTAGIYTVTIKDANNCINTTQVIISNSGGAIISTTKINTYCGYANGTITVKGTGGTLPYEYSIDGFTYQSGNIFNGLSANTYPVSIRDANNCTNTIFVTIINIASAKVTASITNSTCGNANGSILASGTGGILPYKYSIDGINFQASKLFSNLLANTYTVYIKDGNNCINTSTAIVADIAGATVTATATASTCANANGSITATGNGGTPPYQFSIDGVNFQASNVFSGLAANTYTVTIKDANNCINTNAATIINTNGATVTTISTSSTCGNANGSITATGLGGTAPYQFSIDGVNFQSSNLFNGLTANTYTITIKDANNCINTSTAIISNIAGTTITTTTTASTCGNSNGSITATGIGGTAPYQFSIDGVNFQSSNLFSGLAANTYTVTIKDANNCINTNAATISNTNGATVTAIATASKCGNSNGSITATGTGGTAPYQFSIDGVNFQSSNLFSGLAANTYTVTIKDANNCINTNAATIINTNGATVTTINTSSTCGNANGSITANGIGGTAPYQFSIDGVNFQSSNTFSGLAANTYTVTIKDANNCINTNAATISNTNGATVTAITTSSTCGNANGTITATGTGGTAPYLFSIDGVNFQSSNLFSGLAANTYTVTIKDANNCINTNAATISNTNGATVTAIATSSTCGNANGSITATGLGGTAPYQFSIDGVNFQSSNLFNGLAANTYTVTIKDANNCINTNAATISNTNGATVTAIATSSTCGNANGSITATGIGGTAPYQFSIDGVNFQSANTFNGLAANTYTVSIKDANNCINTNAATISNTNGATVTAIATSSTCGNANGSIAATGLGGTTPYQFSIDGVNFQSSNLFSGLAANTYTVTIKDANNCINTNDATISNTNGATVTTITTSSTCGNANGSITATGIGGTAPYQFSIDGLNFQASNVLSGLAANTYTVTIKDANGCINTSSAIVANIAGATITATATASTCGNATGTITATGTGGTTPYQFSIDGVNFQSSNLFNGLTANTYTITIKDANNCINTNDATISNTNGATVTAIATSSTCGNTNGSITATGIGGTAPYQFSIDGVNFQSANVFNGLAANTYTVTIKDANSCINTNAATISNTNGATVTATATASNCGNANGSITATGTGGTTPYQFSIDGVNFQSSNLFSGLAANTYTVTIKDANGCINANAATISNTNGATVTAIATSSTCGNANGIIAATGIGGTIPYLYSIDGVNFQSSNTFSGLAANTYTVTIKDANNCINTNAATISNTNGATVTAIATSSTCGNANGSITATGTGGTAPYQFSIDGVNYQASNVLSGLAANTYTVTIKDANGCINTVAVIISTSNSLIVDAGKDTIICEGKTAQLIASSNAANIVWTPASGLSSTSILNPITSPKITTKYYLTATTGICTARDSITVIVNPAPIANAGADSAICFGKTIQLNGTGGLVYNWSPPTHLSTVNIASPLVIAPIAGSLTYYLGVSDAKGCESLTNDSVTITILPAAKVFAGRDTIVAAGQPLQLNAIDINNAGFVSYNWSPAFGLSNSLIKNPVATLDRNTTYLVTATSREGCSATDDIKISLLLAPEIWVPNAFSPNNDFTNNSFKPILKGIKTLKHFSIYNRYGELVFTTSKQGEGWDGTYKGKPQNIGAYVWVMEAESYNSTVFIRKGTVILIR